MEQERNPERAEVYERIPWEMLEQKKPDRQWLVFAVAGAVVLGALAYSLTSSRAEPTPVTQQAVATPAVASVAPPVPVAPAAPASTNPVVIAEADLLAVNPERLIDAAVSHAEWFVAEYFTLDQSAQHFETLTSLMPVGVPLPTAAEGTMSFVESARAIEVTEVQPLRYDVSVLVRYLLAAGEEGYERQPPLLASVEVVVGEEGASVALPPRITPAVAEPSSPLLAEVPQAVSESAIALSGASQVVGGIQRRDGGWTVVAMVPGPGGVVRPVSVVVP